MELSVIAIEKPEGMGVVIEQAHLIKTVEDLHEALAGTVTNSSSVDIANVCVYVGGLSTDTTGSATTAANGTYTVTGLVADHYIVEFDPTCGGRTTSNLAIQFYDNEPDIGAAAPVSVGTGNVPGVNAALPAASSISGTVTNGSSVDIANVCVYV